MVRFEPGELIAGRFAVEGKLASGGMASVYVARMRLARGVEKRVALKRVHPHLAEDPAFVSMFVDEARLASQLKHRGIVPVHDALEVEGELILVLDYVPGWDLHVVLRKLAVLPPRVAAGIAEACLETLAYVHDATDDDGVPLHVVHRDVTPSNVLLAADGTVRLLDFGVAKAARRSTRTATRTLKGKLAYLSPEQARGEPLDGRSDVYAVGLTLYEMLSGRRANDGEDEAQLIDAAKRVATLAPLEGVPDGLLSVVRRLLAQRDARPDARAAAELLRDWAASSSERRTFLAESLGAPAQPWTESGGSSAVDAALAALLDDGDETGVAPAPSSGRSLLLAPTRAPTSEPVLERSPAPKRRNWFAVAVATSIAIAAAVAITLAAMTPEPSPREPTPPDTARGLVLVNTSPEGAQILIDGSAWDESTPAVLELDAPTTLRLVLADHQPLEVSVEPIAGQTVRVREVLTRLAGRLDIQTTPSGATVRIDDTVVGRTPLILEDQPRRSVHLELALPGHRSHERELDLEGTRVQEIRQTLTAEVRRGALWVNCDVNRVRVEVDGRTVANAVPWRGTVSAGSHTVRVTDATGRSDQRTVRVRAGRTQNVGFFLDG